MIKQLFFVQVIAFALSSKDYQDKRRQLLTKTQTEWPRNRSSNSMSSTWTSMVNTAAVSYSQPGLQALNPPLTSTPISPVIEPAVNEDPQSAAIELDFADTKAHYYVKVSNQQFKYDLPGFLRGEFPLIERYYFPCRGS